MVCIHLGILLFLPCVQKKFEKELILTWIACSAIFVIFPFFPNKIQDSIIYM